MKLKDFQIPKSKVKKLRRTGNRTTFYVGYQSDKIEVVFWYDDGTTDLNVTIFHKEVAVGTFPLVNSYGLSRLIFTMIRFYEVDFGKAEIRTMLKEYLKEK